MRYILFLALLGANLVCAGARLHPEAWYQERAAKKYNAEAEVVMPDGTRCDLVTDKHAIEVDFADKWAEAIGQSLNYAFQTNKKAGILLILENPKEEKHLIRVQSIILHYNLPIDVLAIRAWEEVADASASE